MQNFSFKPIVQWIAHEQMNHTQALRINTLDPCNPYIGTLSTHIQYEHYQQPLKISLAIALNDLRALEPSLSTPKNVVNGKKRCM